MVGERHGSMWIISSVEIEPCICDCGYSQDKDMRLGLLKVL